jgi:hypothetical protein
VRRKSELREKLIANDNQLSSSGYLSCLANSACEHGKCLDDAANNLCGADPACVKAKMD